MSQKNKEFKNAKRVAYEKKQEQQGKKVVNWIFGILVVLAIIFAGYTIYLAS